MKVSIVVPPYDYGGRLYGLVRRRAFFNAVPLGAIAVAAFLREAGHDVQVIDSPALDIDDDATIARLRSFGPEAIGVSATSVIYPAASRLATALRQSFAGLPIFVGGQHSSLFPEWVLDENPAWDAAVFGEGEETAVDLVARLERGGSLDGIPGVCWRKDGAPVCNPPRVPVRELDDHPLPAYDLLELGCYSAPPMRVRRMPAVYMELFRGCAYAKCTYCTSGGGLKNRYRRHSPAVAAEKVAKLNEMYGAREIAFVDDDFVVGAEWIHAFCAELRKRGNPVTWTCYVRASQMDAGIFSAMKAAGCHQVLIGLEVLDNAMLQAMDKDLTVAMSAAAIRAAHTAGIAVIGLFMVGVPGTTPESIYATVEHALQQQVDVAVFSIYRPPPGSPAYAELDWGPNEYIGSFVGQTEAVHVPDGWRDKACVEKVFRDAFRLFYLDRRFILHTARRALSDHILFRGALQGAMALADQFRPRLSKR
jgi:anaerobic magnesium-protoporphyrin IX monomethyl ester cyclase